MDFIEGKPVNQPYYEVNNTDRISTELTFQTKWEDRNSLAFKNSFNFFNRDIEVSGYHFGGKQFSSFSEVNWSSSGSTSSWVAGLNLWTDQFEQIQGSLANPLDYSLTTVGTFVQNIWNASELWTLETGF